MNTFDEFNEFCEGLPGATYVVQWGGSHVWKVGGKVFAIGGWNEGGIGITFKTTPMAFEMLKSGPGLRPAPYLASRGMFWIQDRRTPGLADEELRDYLRASYDLVVQKLPRARRAELGLLP